MSGKTPGDQADPSAAAPLDLPIRTHPALRPLFTLLGMGQRSSRVTLHPGGADAAAHLRITMGWAFRATVPVASIVAAAPYDGRVWGWGVHGWGGRWLVNGSSHGIAVLTIDPPVPSRAVGFRVGLRQVAVSVWERDRLLAALGKPSEPPGAAK